jgi:predicted small lipoprotein YifL
MGSRGFYLLFLVFLTALFLVAGCGQKGPPKAPEEALLMEKNSRAMKTKVAETSKEEVL